MPTEKNKPEKKAAAKPAAKAPAAKAKPAAAAAKPRATKPAAASKPAAKAKPAAAKVVITEADIARRAYFIAEARYRDGRPGNAESDWLEAEQALRAEAAAK